MSANRKYDVVKWLRDQRFRENAFRWAFRTPLNRKKLDDDSIRWAFRTLLNRDPEPAAIETHRPMASMTDLIEQIVNSSEFSLRYMNKNSMRLVDRMLTDQNLISESTASASGHIEVTLLQTSDSQSYFPLLACGRAANEHYAIKNGFAYSAFVGIKRGYFPWHAAFNRLFMLKELAAAGYRGWAFYLDADAYVRDQTFDLRHYLDLHRDKCMIAASGGATDERWEINDGVFLINLGHADARRLVDLWHWHYMSTPDEFLRAAPEWDDVTNDQTRLHDILQANPHLMQHLHVENYTFQDLGHGGFVRQVMRCLDITLEERLEQMRQDIASMPLN